MESCCLCLDIRAYYCRSELLIRLDRFLRMSWYTNMSRVDDRSLITLKKLFPDNKDVFRHVSNIFT